MAPVTPTPWRRLAQIAGDTFQHSAIEPRAVSPLSLTSRESAGQLAERDLVEKRREENSDVKVVVRQDPSGSAPASAQPAESQGEEAKPPAAAEPAKGDDKPSQPSQGDGGNGSSQGAQPTQQPSPPPSQPEPTKTSAPPPPEPTTSSTDGSNNGGNGNNGGNNNGGNNNGGGGNGGNNGGSSNEGNNSGGNNNNSGSSGSADNGSSNNGGTGNNVQPAGGNNQPNPPSSPQPTTGNNQNPSQPQPPSNNTPANVNGNENTSNSNSNANNSPGSNSNNGSGANGNTVNGNGTQQTSQAPQPSAQNAQAANDSNPSSSEVLVDVETTGVFTSFSVFTTTSASKTITTSTPVITSGVFTTRIPTTTITAQNLDTGSGKKNIPAIAGGAVGGLIAFGLLCALFVCWRRKHGRLSVKFQKVVPFSGAAHFVDSSRSSSPANQERGFIEPEVMTQHNLPQVPPSAATRHGSGPSYDQGYTPYHSSPLAVVNGGAMTPSSRSDSPSSTHSRSDSRQSVHPNALTPGATASSNPFEDMEPVPSSSSHSHSRSNSRQSLHPDALTPGGATSPPHDSPYLNNATSPSSYYADGGNSPQSPSGNPFADPFKSTSPSPLNRAGTMPRTPSPLRNQADKASGGFEPGTAM